MLQDHLGSLEVLFEHMASGEEAEITSRASIPSPTITSPFPTIPPNFPPTRPPVPPFPPTSYPPFRAYPPWGSFPAYPYPCPYPSPSSSTVDAPKAFKDGGSTVKFLTFHGTQDANKALKFLQQFDVLFRNGNFTEASKILRVTSYLKDSALYWWDVLSQKTYGQGKISRKISTKIF